jgi:hypothetical protein
MCRHSSNPKASAQNRSRLIYNIAKPTPTPTRSPIPLPAILWAAPVELAFTAEVELVFVDATLTLLLEEVVYNTLLLLVVVTIPPAVLVVSAPNETELVLIVEGEVLDGCTVVVNVGVVKGEDDVDVVASCWKLAASREVVVGTAAGASLVGAESGTTTTGGVDVAAGAGAGVVEEGAATITAAGVDAEDEVPKLLDAVTDSPLLTGTSFTITTSTFTLVTLTSTVVVPNPLEFSKKL